MSESTKEWGDVAGTTSLAHYLAWHATHHKDVEGAEDRDDGFTMKMADGSEVEVSLKSNYSEVALRPPQRDEEMK